MDPQNTAQTWEAVKALIEKGGPLGVLVVCVGMFLVFLWKRTEADAAIEKLRQESLERLGNACHTAQHEMLDRVDSMSERTIGALDRNTEAFGRNSAVVEQALEVVKVDLQRMSRRKPKESSDGSA